VIALKIGKSNFLTYLMQATKHITAESETIILSVKALLQLDCGLLSLPNYNCMHFYYKRKLF